MIINPASYGEEVQIVDIYKHLGTVFDHIQKFNTNSDINTERRGSREFVCCSNSFYLVSVGIRRGCSFIEGLFIWSFICWFGCLSECLKILGVKQRDAGLTLVELSHKESWSDHRLRSQAHFIFVFQFDAFWSALSFAYDHNYSSLLKLFHLLSNKTFKFNLTQWFLFACFVLFSFNCPD